MARLNFLISLLVLFIMMAINLSQVFATSHTSTLDIQLQGEGIAIIHALVDLPRQPEIVFDVLTDYDRWPTLFSEGVQVKVERHSDQWVVTDLIIPHGIIPWETRLKAKSKATQPEKLETVLIDGDFLQYAQVWQLRSVQEGTRTHAELNLTLQPKGWIMKWIPDFLYRWIVKGELEDHFDKLFREVVRRSRR